MTERVFDQIQKRTTDSLSSSPAATPGVSLRAGNNPTHVPNEPTATAGECSSYRLQGPQRQTPQFVRRKAYTIADLSELFGVPRERVESWARRGLLARTQEGHGENVRFTDADVAQFIRQHPKVYNLAGVDRTWFRAMVLGGLPCPEKEFKERRCR